MDRQCPLKGDWPFNRGKNNSQPIFISVYLSTVQPITRPVINWKSLWGFFCCCYLFGGQSLLSGHYAFPRDRGKSFNRVWTVCDTLMDCLAPRASVATSILFSLSLKMDDSVRIVHCFILFWWAILLVKEGRETVNLCYAHVWVNSRYSLPYPRSHPSSLAGLCTRKSLLWRHDLIG